MDTIDGFLKNMHASVDEFAKRVRNDPKLAGGFNAFGLSQGNNLIRGCVCTQTYTRVSFSRRVEQLLHISFSPC